MSGRLIPAAATWISTSPGPGRGTGRLAATSTSGPPGPAGSTADIVSGSVSPCVIDPPAGARRVACAIIDLAPGAVNAAAMDLDELFPDRPDDPLTLLTKQDLDPLSVDELNARIVILEAEIARVKAKLESSVNFRATAESLFKK